MQQKAGKISLGAVSFLNSRPLLYGLDRDPRVSLQVGVPSSLASRLMADEFNAALIPIIDVLRAENQLAVVSDACIACDGETMTVRVFSQVPPDRITRIIGDPDSHTSVVLARVLWRELYDRDIEVVSPTQGSAGIPPALAADATTEARRHGEECRVGRAHQQSTEQNANSKVTATISNQCADSGTRKTSSTDAILLIGDKVVDPHRAGYAYEIDLGGAWRAHTGLPFVFAVWAAKKNALRKDPRIRGFEDTSVREPNDLVAQETANCQWETEAPAEPSCADAQQLSEILNNARDAGVAATAEIARNEGPDHGWPIELADRYLTRCLKYKLTPRMIEGAELFARHARDLGMCPGDAEINWAAAGDENALVAAK